MEETLYVAVIVSDFRSSEPDYEPLSEESFTLIAANSLEEAWARGQVLAREERIDTNEYGDTIWWLARLVGVAEVLVDTFEDGAEFFARYFRNRAAYSQLGFESFDKTEE